MFAQTPTAIDYWMLAGIGLILVILIFLSLAEMSLSQMTKPRAAALAEKGAKSGKALVRLAAEPTLWVNPLLLTVNICQTVQATLMGIVSGRLFGPAGVAIGVVINVLLFFVLAEAVPKTYAVLNPVRGATSTARPISLLVRFWPLRAASAVLIKLTNVIVKGEGLKQGPFIGEQEFLGIVEAAAQESVIEHEERELIESIIEFGDTVVREIMVPRPDAVFIDSDLTITQALDKAVEDGFSRLPVLRKDDDDVDDVVGIVYVGLATLEDCLEELVGEIVDEHDDEDLSLQTLPNGDYLVIGSMPISRLNDELELKVPESEYDTIGGFIFGMLGHVPVQGESVDFDGWRISTETLDGRRIQQVRISALTP